MEEDGAQNTTLQISYINMKENIKMEKKMEKEKNIIMLVNSFLKVNI